MVHVVVAHRALGWVFSVLSLSREAQKIHRYSSMSAGNAEQRKIALRRTQGQGLGDLAG